MWQQLALFVSRSITRFFHFSLEIEFNALRFINYTIPRLCSIYVVATLYINDKEDNEYVNKYMENRMVRQFKRPCLLLAVTLCPISALPCQINQMSDSSRPNSCIIYRERIRAKNVISPNLAHPVFQERHGHERSHNDENCLKTLAFGLPLGLFLKV